MILRPLPRKEIWGHPPLRHPSERVSTFCFSSTVTILIACLRTIKSSACFCQRRTTRRDLPRMLTAKVRMSLHRATCVAEVDPGDF
jgi:hypothetical protein